MGRVPQQPPLPSQRSVTKQAIRLDDLERALAAIQSRMTARAKRTGTAPPRPLPPTDLPFPVAVNDPDAPIGTVYHGSFTLGREAPPETLNPAWKGWGAVPFSGTDITGAPLRFGEFSGHMGPARLYTSTDRDRAEMFGPTYGVDINAAPRDFIGMRHGRGWGRLESPLRPELLTNLLDRVAEKSGSRVTPDELTLEKVIGRLRIPAEKIVGEMHGIAPADVMDAVRNDVIPPDVFNDVHAKIMADAITESGAAGITEQYRPGPTGEQHYAIYNPNVISKLVKLSLLLGGVGAASTARANDSVTAGADEKLADYLRRMQPTQTPANEPGIADAAAEVGQSTLPYYAQQMAGIAKPIHEYSKDFPEMDEYRRRVDEAIDRPVIRSGDRLMSPAEYAAREIYGDDVTPQQIAMTRQIVAGQLSGGQPDPALAGVIKNTLLTLREQGVGGPDARFAGQTLAQREARRFSPVQEGRYMTSPGLDANLDATRAFDILSALQTDKEIDSGDSGAFQSLLALGSAAIAPMQAGQLSAYRNFTPNPIEARTKEALMWDDAARQGRLAGQYRGGMEGGFGKASSWLTNRGMARQAEDYSNFNQYVGEFLVPQFFSGTPVVGDRGQMIRTLAGELHREVPIVPEGASPEEAEKAAESLRNYLNVQGNQYVNDAPVRQRQWNRYMDSLGSMAESSGFGFVRGATDAMKRDNYRYPTPAENALATGWKYALDPTTIATAGMGAIKALGHSGIRGLANMARGMGENLILDQVTTEQPIAVAFPKAVNPELSMSDILSKPITHGEVVNERGEPVDANDPNYERYHQNLKQNQEKLLGELDAYWQRYYRPGGTPPPQR